MKTRDWQRYLDEQARRHGKHSFTLTELAHAAGTGRHSLGVELARLLKAGVIERHGWGLYGLPGTASSEQIVAWLDSHAYITGASALFRHGLITQMPAGITCFTDRRHNRRSAETPAGRFDFVTVSRSVYQPLHEGVVVGPEQALCDYIYLMRRRGVSPDSQVTFRHLDHLRRSVLKGLYRRYPSTVEKSAESLLLSASQRR